MTIVDQTPRDRAAVAGWRRRLEGLGHLYHYASLDGQRLAWFGDLLLRSSLYCRRFNQLNDPFDGEVLPDFRATPERIRSYLEAVVVQHGLSLDTERPHIESIIERRDDPATHKQGWAAHREEIQKLGIACFSEPRDDIPMWAYYANGHKGVCLRFRVSSLLQWHDAGLPPIRVTYEKRYPNVGHYRDSRFRRMRAMLATKARVWKHEQEWRAVFNAGGTHVGFDPAAVDGIIMGCRISDEDEASIRDMLAQRTPRVELLRARPAARAFKLDIVPA